MARAKRSDAAQKRLLSLWEPPERAGTAVGVLATTFTLDTALFEEECLARFAGVQSDPARDGALYRIEREERLASLLCAAVIADVHHCGGHRSLRWDLLAARPSSGVMHAKINLLAWSDHVRVIVSSANLTADGYRRNQECFAVLDFDAGFTDRQLLDPLLTYARELLALTSGPARARAEQLLSWVDQRLPRHRAPIKGIQRHLLLVGPGRPPLLDQLKGLLPSNAPPAEAHVVSPFFDPTLRESGPERTLWQMMKQKGPARVHLHVAGEEAPESKRWRLEVPPHVLDATPKRREGVTTELHPVRVVDVPTDFGRDRRPLHAKTLTLSHETWTALVVGSSNFTSAGMGLSPHVRNFEANVVFILRGLPSDSVRKLMDARALRGGAAVDLAGGVDFDPAFDSEAEDGDSPPPLPAFFKEAVLNGVGDQGYELKLMFEGPPPSGAWAVTHEHALVFDSAKWLSMGQPGRVELSLEREGPPPSMLAVQWASDTHLADWPVNVVSADALPAPSELQGLSLAALLDLLSSARPLHEALRAWLRRQSDDDDADVDGTLELIDPHAKVDTSAFLVKRVQRACWAMRQLRDRIEQPVLSTSAMAWRLNGPVGARAVLNAIQRQCDPNLPDESAFLLCEMWREMRQATVRGLANSQTSPEAGELISLFLEDLHARLMQAMALTSDQMRAYVVEAIQEDADAVT
jgi:hypothetical protein